MTRLAGKSRQQIVDATKHWTRAELVDALFKAVSVEVMLSPRELAAMRSISKYKILELIHNGDLPAYRHMKNGEFRIRVSDVHTWDAMHRVFYRRKDSPSDLPNESPNEQSTDLK